MAIKRYYASIDNTITNAFKNDLTTRATGSNMGRSDILEVFSIYGQTSGSLVNDQDNRDGPSAELARALVKFPVADMSTDRTNSNLAASGSVSFYLRMFNAPHSEPMPRNYVLSASILTQHWEEGNGLDMVEYRDETYNGTGSNWINASGDGTDGTAWTTPGGTFDGDHDKYTWYNYTQKFDNGDEDLSINITNMVEDWLATAVAATADITFYAADVAEIGDTLTLISTDGTSKTYEWVSAGNEDAATGKVHASNTATTQVDSLQSAIESFHGGKITCSQDGTGLVLTLTQAIAGFDGNTATTTTGATTGQILAGDFSGGIQKSNEGICIRLAPEYEAYYSSSAGANTGSQGQAYVLHNTSGSTRSYYTKKFFARSSEFFFKRPHIEARWDDSMKDDRGNFYLSSSLAAPNQNLNTLYLYNYVRGKLQNIPEIDKGLIYVRLFSGSAAGPSGTAGGKGQQNLWLPNIERTVKGITNPVTEKDPTIITGSWAGKNGIYSASFATTSSYDYLYDVWYGPKNRFGGDPGITYYTGTIRPKTLKASMGNPNPRYVTAVPQLKSKYASDETARFRFFIREKDWSPTIYAKASKAVERTIIDSASFKIERASDNYVVVDHGTGSDLHTQLSYDISGNYFDFDMNMLEPGYAYNLRLAYYNDAIGDWQEQKEIFKFRVKK